MDIVDHMTTSQRFSEMSDALCRKLGGFFNVTDEVRRLLHQLCDEIVEFHPGQSIVAWEEPYSSIHLVESGWVFRSKTLDSGARQIVNVVVAGDFVGLNALLFPDSDFDHECKTAVTAFRIPLQRMREALHSTPELTSALFWANAHEESMLAERIVSLGRRSATARAAHVLAEFLARMEIVDGNHGMSELAIPISQEDFSDILGISVVHMNKVLRRLERDEVISFRKGVLMVFDREELERIAGFDNGYLHFTRRNSRRRTQSLMKL